MASASLARKGSRACFWSNSVSVRLSMDLPMINSPTRFMTASMRVASTRSVLSATVVAAEPGALGLIAAEAPSAASVAPAASFAAVHGFRNHELLVFRPGKLRGQLKGRRVRRLRGSRPLEQFANHGVEHRHRRRFGLPLKGGEHRAKTIRRGEDQLREIRPRSLSNLRSKHILEFVRQLTQLVESASCGIAFQSVDGTTNPANDFLIRGTSFELQARFVEGLEDLIGALKEESAQLAATIVAGTTHVVTSFRW